MGLDNGPAGPAWLASENIEVEIAQLDDFARAIEQELTQNFMPSLQQGILPMLTVQAPFGQGGLAEGKFFAGQHKQSSDSLRMLLEEASQGLMSLHMAARSIAAEYRTGDAMAEASMTDVLNGFGGKPGGQTLQGLREQQEQASGDEGPVGDVPAQGQDAIDHFGQDDQSFDIYEKEIVAEGQSGQYVIGGDDEGVTNPSLDVNPDFRG